MKKCSLWALLLVILMSISMILTGCGDKGNENFLVGVWNASYDARDELIKSFEGDEECFQKELNIVFVLEFDEEMASFYIDEECVTEFKANLKEAMTLKLDKLLEEGAVESGVTVDELLVTMGYDYDTYINESLAELDLDAIVESIFEGFGEKLTAKYEYDEDTITLKHDEAEEVLEYSLEGEVMEINILEGEELNFSKI